MEGGPLYPVFPHFFACFPVRAFPHYLNAWDRLNIYGQSLGISLYQDSTVVSLSPGLYCLVVSLDRKLCFTSFLLTQMWNEPSCLRKQHDDRD